MNSILEKLTQEILICNGIESVQIRCEVGSVPCAIVRYVDEDKDISKITGNFYITRFIDNLKSQKDILIENFERCITDNEGNCGIWTTYIELESMSKIDIHDVIRIVDDSKEFIKNSTGQITTRKMYEEFAPFLVKVNNVLSGRYI